MNTINVLLETNSGVYKFVVDFEGNIVARDFNGGYDIDITPCYISYRYRHPRVFEALLSDIQSDIEDMYSRININAFSTLNDLATHIHDVRLKEEQKRLKEEQERIEAEQKLDEDIKEFMADLRSRLQSRMKHVVKKFINAFKGYKILLEVTSHPTGTILYLDNINGVLTDTPNAEEYDVTGTVDITDLYIYRYKW